MAETKRFKVLVGKHSEKDKDGVARVYKANTPHDMVDSKSDLLKQNSPGSTKFELVTDDYLLKRKLPPAPVVGRQAVEPPVPEEPSAPPAPTPPAKPQPAQTPSGSKKLDDMSLKELQDLATEEHIDLKGSKDLVEVRKAIRAGLKGQ